MSFWIVFQKIIQLFLIVLIGFAANKLHFFNRDLREKVTALVLNITLPGVILSTVWGEGDLPSPGQFLLYFAMVLLFFAVQFAVGYDRPDAGCQIQGKRRYDGQTDLAVCSLQRGHDSDDRCHSHVRKLWYSACKQCIVYVAVHCVKTAGRFLKGYMRTAAQRRF